MEPNEQRDARLWKIARKRASFKQHLISYILINGFLWFIWWWGAGIEDGGIPWPAWPTAGWGLAVAFEYFGAYGHDRQSAVEKEYERLRKEQQNS